MDQVFTRQTLSLSSRTVNGRGLGDVQRFSGGVNSWVDWLEDPLSALHWAIWQTRETVSVNRVGIGRPSTSARRAPFQSKFGEYGIQIIYL